jgi:lycopene cyclase CruP
LRFPLGAQVKAKLLGRKLPSKELRAWFGLDAFYLPMPSNLARDLRQGDSPPNSLDYKSIREFRILPRNGCFYVEFVYKLEVVKSDVNPDFVLGIDPGLNNWLDHCFKR